jgi:hypothetical protein
MPPPKGAQFSTTQLLLQRCRLSHSSYLSTSSHPFSSTIFHRTSSHGQEKDRDTAYHCKSCGRYPSCGWCCRLCGYSQHLISRRVFFYPVCTNQTKLTSCIHSMNAIARLPFKRHAIFLCYLHVIWAIFDIEVLALSHFFSSARTVCSRKLMSLVYFAPSM